ncbi:uncharacterized protein LOC127853363 isoform X3 [Dreissena polymorpha]|uniref:uncharacterized protein LOC127853363 isoform X3 n=1 Tax=Dreissena polymorpha TaxID=45954 RepID=UPI002264DC5F|nr:uncharacterized protein LOC127853363 isoform X3 [Dreissena polymorpha]
MSTQEWLVLLTVGFLLKESTAAVQMKILNSHISVTSVGETHLNWTANEVIDGLVNHLGDSADSCGCCAALERPASVQLTLDTTYIVEKIVVLGRTDREYTQFNNIKLSLGRRDKPLQDETLDMQNRSYAMTILAPPRELDVVRVSSTGQNVNTYMTICEIMIYRQADCLPGKYSVNCSKECHCLTGPCESVTGKCMPALCKDGWRGPACNETCDPGHFGKNCSSACHCYNGSSCHHISGHCPDGQCEPGWTQSNCSVVQIQIRNVHISVTSNGIPYSQWTADKVNDGIVNNRGRADDCGCCAALKRPASVQLTLDKTYIVEKIIVLGRADTDAKQFNITLSLGRQNKPLQDEAFSFKSWSIAMTELAPPRELDAVRVSGGTGQNIDTYMTICEIMIYRQADCLPGKYSVNCSKECHCLTGPCESVTGKCMPALCKDGWKGPACNETCKTGFYGQSCSMDCNCDTCHHATGSCVGSLQCHDGYNMEDGFCTPCDPGHFGENCSSACHCYNGSSCHHISGHCPDGQCEPGWTQSNCSVACETGKFGTNCSFNCHCLNGETCDPISGRCPNDQCAPGWTLRNCSDACKTGFYGQSCAMDCHCDTCNHVTGSCEGSLQCHDGYTMEHGFCTPCKPGFYGQRCSRECHCDTCHHVNGSCVMSLQCHAGYRMENGFCTTHEKIGESTTINVVGVVCGCIAVVVTIIGVTLLTVYYKRRQLHSAKGHTKLSTPDQKETRFNKGFDHSDRANDDKSVFVQEKAEVASKNVSLLLSGKEKIVPCDDNDYYSFKTVGSGIQIYELWDYIHEKCQSGSTFFEEEFKKFKSGLIHKHDIASSEENTGKTRYKQMYAYDHNRVPLTKEIDGDSEYINASYIHGFEKAKKFIASQGPTEKNLDDFWCMIWQQRVDKIVMLTNLIEMGTMKCLQYWPDELNCVCKYGRIDVKYVDVEEMFDYNIRTFTIEKGHDARIVTQLHFKSWPDKGVPDTAWCLVDFWRAVNTQEEHPSPILVHCSAGVGRTGTFIALDNLISQAHMETCVRPFQIVEALREQRVSMVQTKEQYAYLHEALAEALLVGTHHVLTRQFESVHLFMIGKDSISTANRLEQQLELLKRSVESDEGHLHLVTRPEAEYGNIGPQVTEIDVYRPQQQRKSEPTDEININTFNALTGIIVLRKPNEQQLPMFWSRLEKLGSTTLIDLASGDIEMKHLLMNRKDGTHATKGPSAIKLEHQNGFVEITYSMTHETFRDKIIKHFVLTSTDRKPLLEMICAVHTWQSEMADDSPILILDSGGFRKCGVVAVLLNEIYRILELNGRINIVQSVRTMVHKNSLLIRNKMQFKFCYDAILDFIQQQGVYQNY